jgi:hypothetical protein
MTTLIKLTAPEGDVYVNPDQVRLVRKGKTDTIVVFDKDHTCVVTQDLAANPSKQDEQCTIPSPQTALQSHHAMAS